MIKKNIILLPLIFFIFNILPFGKAFAQYSGPGFYGDAWFPGSTSTSTVNTTLGAVAQSLGLASDYGITTVGSVAVAFSTNVQGSPSAQKIQLYCSTTKAISESASLGNCGVWLIGYATTTGNDRLVTEYFTVNASTSIPLNSSRYYTLYLVRNPNFSTNDAMWWGGATTTAIFGNGRCFQPNTNGEDCRDELNLENGYGARDLYFVLYGEAQTTRVTASIPVGGSTVPITGTSTSEIDINASVFVQESDYSGFLDTNYLSINIRKYGFLGYDYAEKFELDDVANQDVSSTAELTHGPGRYIMTFRIWNADVIAESIETLYSSTTYFYLGTDTGTSTQGIFGRAQETFEQGLASVECDFTWTDWSFKGVISCLFDYTRVLSETFVQVASDLKDELQAIFVRKFPWGYAFRVYDIISNPTFATSSLPSLVIPMPVEWHGSGASIDLTPWTALEDTMTELEQATSSATTSPIMDTINYWTNILFGVFFALYVVKRVFDLDVGFGDLHESEIKNKKRTPEEVARLDSLRK